MPLKDEYTRVSNGYLEIRAKLGNGYPSASGRSQVVHSTGGFQPVADSDVRVNLTAIKATR